MKIFVKNKHKWSHAQQYARIKNYKFVIVTEKTINKFIQM